MTEMNIKKLITKVIQEQEDQRKEAKGNNWEDSTRLLKDVIAGCQGVDFLKNRPVNAMTKDSPKNANGVALYSNFPDLKSDVVSYATGKDNSGTGYIVFGVQDPNLKYPALLGYRVSGGQLPDRITGGVARNCERIQKIEDVGQSYLSPMDQAKLNDFLKMQGGLYVQIDPQDPLNYREYKMKDLKDLDGNPLLKNPGEGVVWKKVSSGKAEMGDVATESDNYMSGQGFTQKKPPVGSYEADLGFYLKDVMSDLPSLSIDPELRDTLIYFPDASQINLQPSKQECRAVIKKLSDCRTATNKAGCQQDLFKNKFIALSCGDKKYVGGVVGLKDDYNQLLTDSGPFGLARLSRARGKAKFRSMTESIKSKINKSLNEEFNKFSFSKKKIDFDPFLIESVSNKLLKDIKLDLEKTSKRINRLNESDLGDNITSGIKSIGSSLGSGFGSKVFQGVKEELALKIIKSLGFPTDSFITLLLVNIIANTPIKQLPQLFQDCNFSGEIVMKSALEAFLDQQMNKSGFDSFVYRALKNVVTETAANTSLYKELEEMAVEFVCPILKKIPGMMKSMGLSFF